MYQVVLIEHNKKSVVLETKDLSRAVEVFKIYQDKYLNVRLYNKLDFDKVLGKEVK